MAITDFNNWSNSLPFTVFRRVGHVLNLRKEGPRSNLRLAFPVEADAKHNNVPPWRVPANLNRQYRLDGQKPIQERAGGKDPGHSPALLKRDLCFHPIPCNHPIGGSQVDSGVKTVSPRFWKQLLP